MALTRSFKELVPKRVGEDPEFGAALLREGIDTMLTGDVDTGKAILRDYIKAKRAISDTQAEATDRKAWQGPWQLLEAVRECEVRHGKTGRPSNHLIYRKYS
jgi:hypothetical protein